MIPIKHHELTLKQISSTKCKSMNLDEDVPKQTLVCLSLKLFQLKAQYEQKNADLFTNIDLNINNHNK